MNAPHPVNPVESPNPLRWLSRRVLALLAALAILAGPSLLPETIPGARAQENLPFKVYPQPAQREVWPGTSITLNFERDIDRASIVAALTMTPDLRRDLVWNGDRQLELRPYEPLAAEASYRLELGTGALDASGRPLLDKPYAWSFVTSRHQTTLGFGWGLPVQLLAPSGKHGAGVQPGYPRVTLDFAIYPLDLAGFARRYAPLEQGGENPIDVEGLSQSATWQTHVDNSQGMSGIGLPKGTPPGLYVLETRHADLGRARALVVYSDHALVAKRGRQGLDAWLTTWLSARPDAGARILALDAAGATLAEATTDADGLADLGDLAESAALLAAEVAGETTLVGLDANWASNQGYWRWWGGWYDPAAPRYTGHSHTDRPIYRPGHSVHWKTSIREFAGDDPGLSVIAPTTPVSVTIRDAKGNVIVRETPAVDDFGSVAGTLELGDEVALGWWQIETRVGDQTLSGSFQVEEYVKPDFEVEIQPDADYYVRGDTASITVQADYYFGQPVAGAAVVLRAFRGYWWRGQDGTQPVSQMEGQSGPDGSFTGQLKLDGNESYAETYTLEAEVLDASRRPVYATRYVLVHPADFALTLQSDRYGVELGDPVVFTAATIGHDGQPAAGREVTVVIQRYTRDGTRDSGRQTVRTGADGKAELRYPDLGEGWYSFRAEAADDGGRRVTAYSYAWLYDGQRPWYWWGGLELSTDRDRYAPGETAQILVKSPLTTTALITIERDEVYEERVVEISGATTLSVPIEARYAPNVTVKVHMWQPNTSEWAGKESQIVTASVDLVVPADDKHLSVEILPDAAEHGPGEEASFTLRVRDAAGQPVDAQLSFALVDKAVLALASDRSGDIFDAFWNRWQDATRTYDSAVPGQTYNDRGVEDGAGGGAPVAPSPGGRDGNQADEEPSRAQPRSEFRDTAYWDARVETGPDGEARITLTLPDNLTTWQAMARAISRESLAGQGSAELLVTKPIIAQPALPRFAVQGDQFLLDVLSRNYAMPGELGATCTLDTPGLIQLDPGARSLSLPQGETRAARWSVVASDLGVGRVSAELDTPAGADAIELPLEVQPFSVPERFVVSGSTESDAAEVFDVPYKTVPESSTVTLRLAPSLAFGVLEGVESLIGYPYGCVEQTMGKVLPNAVVGRLAKVIELDAPEITQELPEYMAAGLQKLYGFQNADGSWGWWYSSGNLYTTSYVLQGLVLVGEAGYAVDPQVLARGFAWLAANIGQPAEGGPRSPEPDPAKDDLRLKAYAAYVLSLGGMPVEADLLDRLYAGRADLDAFALSTLAVTLAQAGDARAEPALADLVARSERTATTVWWPAERPGERWDWYYWYSMASTEKSTAMALEALTQVDPGSELAPMAARWLLEHRWGTGWRTTQATAFAVLALTDHLLTSGDLEADYAWRVTLDGREIGSGRVDASNVTSPIDPLIIPGSELTPGPHTLGIGKTGTGTIYYTAVGDLALFYSGFAATEAAGMGMRLSREYMPISGRSDGQGWHAGDLINVRLTIDTQDELHYLIIEDKLPAGFEGLNQSLETETTRIPGGERPWWRWWGYERHEVRDETVSFFRSYLPPGTHTFEYAARAVTPGSFSARPAEAYAMYRPEVWARSASARIEVDPDRVANRPDLPGDFNRDCRLTAFDASLVADSWAEGQGRDLTGDGRVSVADITVASGRADEALVCGDAVPAAPGEVGRVTLGLDLPETVHQNRDFEVRFTLDFDSRNEAAQLGAWEATIPLPKGVELVDYRVSSAGLAAGLKLGPVTRAADGSLRIGGWYPEGVDPDSGGFGVDGLPYAFLTLHAGTGTPFRLDGSDVEVRSSTGGLFRAAESRGVDVVPEPWNPVDQIYLPGLRQRTR
ncbi:MAG: Ig-like domain-containing protein [Chloroflexi bacterium]|nr:Ig-like domain-containing protein [Chloroflexota bacterium]